MKSKATVPKMANGVAVGTGLAVKVGMGVNVGEGSMTGVVVIVGAVIGAQAETSKVIKPRTEI